MDQTRAEIEAEITRLCDKLAIVDMQDELQARRDWMVRYDFKLGYDPIGAREYGRDGALVRIPDNAPAYKDVPRQPLVGTDPAEIDDVTQFIGHHETGPGVQPYVG